MVPLAHLRPQPKRRFDRSQTGPRLVADLLARTSLLLVIGQIPARCRPATNLGLVRNQDNVMEFGFYRLKDGDVLRLRMYM